MLVFTVDPSSRDYHHCPPPSSVCPTLHTHTHTITNDNHHAISINLSRNNVIESRVPVSIDSTQTENSIHHTRQAYTTGTQPNVCNIVSLLPLDRPLFTDLVKRVPPIPPANIIYFSSAKSKNSNADDAIRGGGGGGGQLSMESSSIPATIVSMIINRESTTRRRGEKRGLEKKRPPFPVLTS